MTAPHSTYHGQNPYFNVPVDLRAPEQAPGGVPYACVAAHVSATRASQGGTIDILSSD
jgi:hypothetical protein